MLEQGLTQSVTVRRSVRDVPQVCLKSLFRLLSFPYSLINTQNGALMEGGNDRTASFRIVS